MPKATSKASSSSSSKPAPRSSAPTVVKAEDLDLKKLTFDKAYKKSEDAPYSSYSLKYPNSRIIVRVEGRIINLSDEYGPPKLALLPLSDKAASKLASIADLWEARENIRGEVGEAEIEKSYSTEWKVDDGSSFNVLLGGKFKGDKALKKGSQVRVLLDISLSIDTSKARAGTQFWLRGFKVLKETEEFDIEAALDD